MKAAPKLLASVITAVALVALLVQTGACDDASTTAGTGASNVGGAGTTTSTPTSTSTTSSPSGSGCTVAACDDGIECTKDSCALDGSCLHIVGPCGPGEYCEPKDGCVSPPACVSISDCEAAWAGDVCKASITCDGATSTCNFEPLDKDKDGHPPVICGGDDCDDTSADAHPGGVDPLYCDNVDRDCDGKDVADTMSNDLACGMCGTFCSPPSKCMGGQCVCTATTCGTLCVDLSKDKAHCGSCTNDCGSAPCVNGSCNCGGLTLCTQAGGYCADLTNEFQNCGTCGHMCLSNEQCDLGKCCAPGQKNCGGTCTFTSYDSANCGTCGHACAGGLTCSGGNCVMGTTVSASSASTGSGGSCGDGNINGVLGEQCDDGNVMDGDGCSSSCQIE